MPTYPGAAGGENFLAVFYLMAAQIQIVFKAVKTAGLLTKKHPGLWETK